MATGEASSTIWQQLLRLRLEDRPAVRGEVAQARDCLVQPPAKRSTPEGTKGRAPFSPPSSGTCGQAQKTRYLRGAAGNIGVFGVVAQGEEPAVAAGDCTCPCAKATPDGCDRRRGYPLAVPISQGDTGARSWLVARG